MTTITFTAEQLETIKRSLLRSIYDLQENYERNEVLKDELSASMLL